MRTDPPVSFGVRSTFCVSISKATRSSFNKIDFIKILHLQFTIIKIEIEKTQVYNR